MSQPNINVSLTNPGEHEAIGEVQPPWLALKRRQKNSGTSYTDQGES